MQFMATEERRARYWARSFAGWHEFAAVQPNRAHHALAEMQRMGWADSIITQNVDRLHHKAGSRDIIELHGTTHRQVSNELKDLQVSCLHLVAVVPLYCGAHVCRLGGTTRLFVIDSLTAVCKMVLYECIALYDTLTFDDLTL